MMGFNIRVMTVLDSDISFLFSGNRGIWVVSRSNWPFHRKGTPHEVWQTSRECQPVAEGIFRVVTIMWLQETKMKKKGNIINSSMEANTCISYMVVPWVISFNTGGPPQRKVVYDVSSSERKDHYLRCLQHWDRNARHPKASKSSTSTGTIHYAE